MKVQLVFLKQLFYRDSETNINAFEFIKQIGKGAFGKVWLVRHKKYNELYAMKIVDCISNKNQSNFVNVVQESAIYDLLTGSYIVKTLYKIFYKNYFCFVMEYMYGGDFSQALSNLGRFSLDAAKFYIAELILAVEHLHSLQIIHRDLKPENLLLDSSGHLKLTDFGLSEYSAQKNSKLIGTPDYIPPELIKGESNFGMKGDI